MRDAIVLDFELVLTTAMQRIALALAWSGGKVMHCEAACALLRWPDTRIHELEKNLYNFKPAAFLPGYHWLPGIWRAQRAAVVRQILEHARVLGLREPMFVYPYAGLFLLEVTKAMKAHGRFLVHVYMDYREGPELRNVGLSDVTLVIPRTMFHRLRARWGEKVHRIPQGVDLRPYRGLRADAEQAPPTLAAIPRPRLGYVGNGADGRLNARVLRELLERRREWSFVSFGKAPAVPLPNAYVVPWQNQEALARCVAAFDVGFMPYDCSYELHFHCVPMKLLDYFALGLPVVATPLLYLREYKDLVYLGETAEELERAVEAALAEPMDSPKRQKRKEVAEAHSIEALAKVLSRILG